MNAFRADIIQFLKSRLPLDEAELQRAIEVPPRSNLATTPFPAFRSPKILRKAPRVITELATAFQPNGAGAESPCHWAIRQFFRGSWLYSRADARGHR